MTYEGLVTASSKEQPHLGGNIKEGDPFTHAPSAWNHLIDRFALKTVMDLGSGMGYASHFFHKKGCQVIAVDGLEENINKSIYPSIRCDLTQSAVHCRVDMVHCQEVVEHIEEVFLENVLSSLACGKFIVMTHALPGQVGYHHVNLKPAEYWIEHLRRYKCELLEEDTHRLRALAVQDNAIYLAASGMVFANRGR